MIASPSDLRNPREDPDDVEHVAAAVDEGRWPDFVGIGAIKSGTTWLWSCLRQHPELFLPRMKELEFFTERFALGYQWYRGFFAEAGSRRCGEISPQYLHSGEAAQRMRCLVGHSRLLVCLRNPADRAYSHYLMDARADAALSDAEKQRRFHELALEGSSKYVSFGDYAAQLDPYLDAFGRERMHLLFFEDIAREPLEVFRQVCRFLAVSETFVPLRASEAVNAAKRYRSVRLFNLLRAGVRIAEQVGLAPLILQLKRAAIRDRVLAMLETSHAYAPMWPQTRKVLIERYAAGNARLARVVDRDLRSWSVG
jgi:hypothetical protein